MAWRDEMGNEITLHGQSSIVPYADMEKMAAVIAQSGLFGVKNQVQALALMLIAQSEGLHPATAARDYHVIQGRPALKADAMLAKFQSAGGKVEWLVYTDAKCEATFSHQQGGKVTVAWTLEMARSAGLAGKDVWKQYPRAMLRARVISEGIRTVYPAVLCGLYTPEEVRDMAEVSGTAETSGPNMPPQPAPQAIEQEPAAYDFANAEFIINSIDDDAELAQWLAQERIKNNWKKVDHPHYVAVKAVCAERAEQIRSKRKSLSPTPGKAATPESLAKAGFDGNNPTPFDDGLEVIE